jgi:hypothetical protein
VLIVEQNAAGAEGVDRAYLLEAGTIRASGTSKDDVHRHHQAGLSRGSGQGEHAGISRHLRYLSAGVVVNGILLGGVLALLALGLNLIFGVIDVT